MIGKRGFTLIEILVVIGIMAIIMMGVLALMSPAEKYRQAKDSEAMSAMSQVVQALQSYVTVHQYASFPSMSEWSGWDNSNILIVNGELKNMPHLPDGYTTTYDIYGSSVPYVNAVLTVNLNSTKYESYCPGQNPYWMWDVRNGRLCGYCGTAPPVSDGGAAGNTCSF